MAALKFLHTNLRQVLASSSELKTQIDQQWLEYVDFFCRRMKPALETIPEFTQRERLDPTEALVEILSCENPAKQSERFQALYTSLLQFRNHFQTDSPLQQALLLLLWEIYAHKPAHIRSMFVLGLKILRGFFLEAELPQKPSLASERNQIINFLVTPPDDNVQPEVKMYCNQIQAGISELKVGRNQRVYDKNQSVNKFFIQLLKSKSVPNDPFPIQFCLGECAKAATLKCLQGLREQMMDSFDKEEDDIEDIPRGQRDLEPGIHILYGPSGCGKTYRIQKLLQQRWGFFFSSTNFSQGGPDCIAITSPCRPQCCRASKDTQTWYADIQSIKGVTPDCSAWAESRMNLLLACRFVILAEFLQMRCLPGEKLRMQWNRLQLACDEHGDVFNILFSVARFLDITSLDLLGTFSLPISEDIINSLPGHSAPFLVCVDDAQRDLYGAIPAGTGQLNARLRKPLELFLSGMHSFLSWENIDFRIVLSTLQIEEVVGCIKRQAPSMEQAARFSWNKTSTATAQLPPPQVSWTIHRDFALVQNEAQFLDLLKRSGLVCDRRSRELIIHESRALRGRYLWSTLFIQDLKERDIINAETVKQSRQKTVHVVKRELVQRLKDVEKRSLEQMVQEAQNQAMGFGNCTDRTGTLIDRMQEIQEQQMQYLETLDELCWLAIRSDLSGEVSVFSTARKQDMIAHGFAFEEDTSALQDGVHQTRPGKGIKRPFEEVDGDAVSQVRLPAVNLKERIAVEAAIEYFQTCSLPDGASRYERTLEHFVFTEQQCANALGRTAEAFFAWRMRKLLRNLKPDADPVLPQNDESHRQDLLTLLIGRAIRVPDFMNGSQVQCFSVNGKLNQYRLLEGRSTAYNEAASIKRPARLWEWMSNIRHRKADEGLAATFWFPSETAGPDVLFALTRPILESEEAKMPDVVLCAAKLEQGPDPTHHPSIQGLDPRMWFSNSYDNIGYERRCMLVELKEWELKGWPIVSLYITMRAEPPSNDGCIVQEALRDVSLDVGKVLMGHNHFFNWLGATHTRNLFGEAFLRLQNTHRA